VFIIYHVQAINHLWVCWKCNTNALCILDSYTLFTLLYLTLYYFSSAMYVLYFNIYNMCHILYTYGQNNVRPVVTLFPYYMYVFPD